MSTPHQCLTPRRIQLQVSGAGLSNRLYALISSTVLAALTHRILELDFVVDKSFGIEFHAIFDPVRELDYYRQHHLHGFIYHKDDEKINFKHYRAKGGSPIIHDGYEIHEKRLCKILLDHHNPMHFRFLTDYALFQSIDRDCEVIRIESNQFFAPALYRIPDVWCNITDALAVVYRDRMNKIRTNYPSPFADFLRTFYRLAARIQEKAEITKKRFEGKSYLSIHARGFYDNEGKSTKLLLECGNQLLRNGNVSYIFFATES